MAPRNTARKDPPVTKRFIIIINIICVAETLGTFGGKRVKPSYFCAVMTAALRINVFLFFYKYSLLDPVCFLITEPAVHNDQPLTQLLMVNMPVL